MQKGLCRIAEFRDRSRCTGTGSSVTLSITGLPKGTTGSFSTNPITATATSTLTIKANRNAPAGSFTPTITGSNGSVTHNPNPPLVLTIN
jgi:hypothetical protein